MAESVVKRREWVGRVISNKMNKTVVVAVERQVVHPIYRKVLRRMTKFKAHDEQNACGIGDRVRMIETQAYQQGQALAGGRDFGKRTCGLDGGVPDEDRRHHDSELHIHGRG